MARRTWSRLYAHRSRTRRAAAGSGSRGPAGTCTEQRPAEPRGPGAHAEEGRRLRESRAGPPRTRPRSRARTCWKGGDNGESLEPPRPLREGGARAGARAGRPLSPQHTQRLVQPALPAEVLNHPRQPATAASARDPRISMPGAKLMGGVCTHPFEIRRVSPKPGERKDHPAAGGEVAKKGTRPPRAKEGSPHLDTHAARQPRAQGTPSRAGKGTQPKRARLLGEAGQARETRGDG